MADAPAVLPAALRAMLGEPEARTIAEAPRAQRLAETARVLAVPEAEALTRLAAAAGLPVAADLRIDPEARPLLPARLADDFQVVPIQVPAAKPDELHLAASWLPDDLTRDWIATFVPRRLCWHLAPAPRVSQLIRENYGVGAGSLDEAEAPEDALPAARAGDLEADEDAAVVRFVTEIISQAIADGATDIHFEPQEGQLRIRYRVDGLLVPVPVPENLLRYQDAIISRLKIMARLNISERRLPQDGRINFKSGGHGLDIRVSTIPTIYAESVSLRLLNLRREAYSMDRIGLTPPEQAVVRRVLESPHGIVLVTGPTGSGKSTSLNAFLREINSTDLRIVTVEDPIEYEVAGANQMQVNPDIGLTFAGALRHILRQDPDVIMVGEVRDRETADIAIRASLTGHLVFTTLHTNDAPGAITRLIDMGIEPFLIASALQLVIAQRLVRRLCPHCVRPQPAPAAKLRETLAALGLDPALAGGVTEMAAPGGCDRCRGTGFRGRVGLFEILRPDEEMHDLIVRREPTRVLTRCAVAQGMKPLALVGWERALAGQTTLDEVLRVVAAEK